jgi:hypothetical protein
MRALAEVIRNNPTARHEIAQGFELIADAMDAPCEDCGAQHSAGIGLDAPDVGAEPVAVGGTV